MKQAIVVYSNAFNEEQKMTLEIVKRVLKERKIKSSFCDRRVLNNANFLDCELAIAIGGDGTFLRTAHFIRDDTPVLGVNSDIKNKEGFYMQSSRYDFEKKIAMVQNGDFAVKKFMRLECHLNKNKIEELALNEFYFGSCKPYLTSRYRLEIGNSRERQRSSGVIISTPTGSNAWLKAGGTKARIGAKEFAYMVREPYENRILGNYNLLFGIIKTGGEIRIKPEMSGAIAVADSLSREYKIDYGDSASVRASDSFLRAVHFPQDD